MDPITIGGDAATQFLQRFGRTPMAIASEHMHLFPMRQPSAPGSEDRQLGRGNPRSREMVRAAAVKSMQLGEFTPAGWTCGYFKTADGLAIIPIWGDLGPMRGYWAWCWYEDLAEAANAAAKDGDVKSILFHIDSPGGNVTGLADCAAAIEAAAALKPCAAFANDYATSAAYWIAAATGTVSAPVTGIVGSIGALCVHDEISRALDNAGVKVTVVRSDPRKAEANFFEPLTAQALQALQHEVTICADDFKKAIARLRGVDGIMIASTQAACVPMDQALTMRFADRVETFADACAAVLARAQPVGAVAPVTAAPAVAKAGHRAAAGGAKASPAATPKPARRNSAQQAPRRGPNHSQGRTQTTRRSAMDPTTLPIEEQVARRQQIADLVATEPADDNEASAQYLQICTIVNTPYEAETPAEGEGEPAPATPAAKGNQIALISASAEAKANPALALVAIQTGMSLAQFKAAAKAAPAGKQGAAGFDRKMQGTDGATPAGNGGAGAEGKKKDETVVQMPTAQSAFAKRRAAQGGKRG